MSLVTGLSQPSYIATFENLIAVVGGHMVKIYAAPLANASRPIATFATTGSGQPAFDFNGRLFVPDGTSVAVFAPPLSNASQEGHVATAGLTTAAYVAFGSGGDLYAAQSRDGSIVAYAAPFQTPTFTIPTNDGAGVDCGGLSGLTFDIAGNLYVSSASVLCGVAGTLVFNTPLGVASRPAFTLANVANGVGVGATGVAVDDHGNLYVANNYLATSRPAGTENVAVFAAPITANSVPATVVSIPAGTLPSLAIGSL